MLANIGLYMLLCYGIWLYVVETGKGKAIEDLIKDSIVWIVCHPITTITSIFLLWITMVLPYDLPLFNWMYPIWWSLIWTIPIGAIGIIAIVHIKKQEEKIVKMILKKLIIKK